jgi:TubC N-terminal docking domain
VTAPELLSQLHTLGISLELQDGRIFARPKDRLTPDLLETLKSQKQALLSLLLPSRAETVDGCPGHWLHISVLPPRGQHAITQSADGQGLRYRVCLFGKWYVLRFATHVSETHVEVACTFPKRRMFADLNEFYRWAWAETFYGELQYKAVN